MKVTKANKRGLLKDYRHKYKVNMWLTAVGVSSVPLFLALESKRTFLPRFSQSWYTISLIWLGSSWGSGQLNGRKDGQRAGKGQRESEDEKWRWEMKTESGRENKIMQLVQYWFKMCLPGEANWMNDKNGKHLAQHLKVFFYRKILRFWGK